MKNLLALVIVSAFLLPTLSFAEILVGKVDIQKILVTVKEGVKVRDQLKKTFDSKQDLLKKEEDKIRKMQEDYKKQSLVMNDKAKAEKEGKIQESIMKLQQTTMDYQKEIQDMEQNLKKPILENLKDIIDDVSKAANVDVTFEVSTSAVIYAKSEKDLTDEVIKAYDKKHPGKK